MDLNRWVNVDFSRFYLGAFYQNLGLLQGVENLPVD
jgi:hypothetical protein